jgi:integrase
MFIRKDIYHYRRRIPAELVDLFGRKEVTKSLGTNVPRKAARLSSYFDGQLESLFHSCKFNSITPEIAQARLHAILHKVAPQPELQEDKPTTIVIAAPSRRTGKRLSEAIEAFSKEKEHSWTTKTRKEYSGVFDRLLKGLTDPWLQDLDRPILVAYRDVLTHEGKSIKTVNKYLQSLSTVLRHANRLKWIQGNPAEGLGLQDSRRPDEIRRAFTSEEIKTIFESLQNDKQAFYAVGRHERYWLPLLGIYTGARVNELAQLSVSDVFEEEGIPAIAITSSGGEGKRIKTETSRRTIPLHQDLLTLGFLVYVQNIRQQGHSSLFPALKLGPNGYSHYFVSQHFSGKNGWLRTILPDLEAGMSFHCLRHSFAEKLKDAEIEERLIEEIMGHRLTSLSLGRYGKPYKAGVRIRAINQIRYGLIPEVQEKTAYDFDINQECDYLTCGETTIRVDLDEGVTPIQLLQYQRPDIHGYSPFHNEIKAFLQD